MNWLTKRIFSSFYIKNCMIFTESHLIRTQYYTCLSKINNLKVQEGHKRISSLKSMRELNFDFGKTRGFLGDALGKLFIPQKFEQKQAGFLWYKSLEEVEFEEFLTLLQMPDTYFSWFRVMGLHVWMMLFRMSQDGSKLRYVREGMMEAMWLDMEERARMLNMNKSFTKTFKKLYEKFKVTLFLYDYGYMEDDTALASVIWSVFFERECDDPEKLEAVVRFIRCQIHHLMLLDIKNLELIDNTKIWTSLKPHFARHLT